MFSLLYLVFLLSLLLLLCFRIVEGSMHTFLYEIRNIKLNYTKINLETKYFPPYNDNDLVMPKIIEYEVKLKANIVNIAKVVIAVLSSPHNFKKRYSFRKNSKEVCNKNRKCKFIFFIGCSKYENKYLINKEIKMYNDLVQFSFQNSYLNLTLLSVMALKFCFKKFKRIKFYIKTDDDILINYSLLFNVIKSINFNSNCIYGHYGRKFKVNRNNRSDSYIPYIEYPYEYAPQYVFGGLLIITYAALTKIYNTTLYEQFYVYKEDVNLGIICKICNVSVFQFPFNFDIYTKKRDCKMNNNSIGVEIYSKEDKFYCLK